MTLPPFSVDLILILASFIGAAITSVFGLSGGLFLLAVMANFFPPAVLIPLHAIIMSGTNLSRAASMRAHVNWSFVSPLLVGSVVGVIIASNLFIVLPEKALLITLGIGLIVLTWLPPLPSLKKVSLPFMWPTLSVITGMLSTFMGAGGVLLGAAIARLNWKRQHYVATCAAIAGTQHGAKSIIFTGWLGFPLTNYLPLIAMLLVAGVAGMYVGKHFLERVHEKLFRIGLKTIITLLALRLLFIALI